MRRGLIVVLLSCLALVSLPQLAAAQDDEVFVDPDSPTGREYDIPLERARRDATSNPDAEVPYRSRTAPLFGEGIETGSSSGSPGTGGDGGSGTGSGAARSGAKAEERERKRRAPLPSTVEAAVKQPGAPTQDTTLLALIGAAAAGVVGVGLAAGFVLRRRRG